ncbi:MAG: DctP family TRAP transporter solute-binding subunit, partial [Betaproteobacteria bacterium]|nr:DctP family TRAP transporter solute-binding subunit [Betaproteobacteria bacterium]
RRTLDAIAAAVTRPWTLMEICGGQTHTLVRSGLDRMLPPSLTLVHGPGCPVCGTPLEQIDRAIALARRPEVIFTSFGDMLRVPGSDTDLLSQVRNGSVDFFNLSSLILATYVPVSGITSVGFAFKNYDDVWKAMDGELGNHIRAEIAKTPIFTVSKIWDNGFRHVTSSGREIKSAADLKGFKMRVPPAPPLTSLFQALEAAPSPINFNEVYTALQTKVVEGQENPLAIISTARLYEVQKSCSLTGHVWDGYWVLGNKRSFQKLPADLQQIITRELDKSATDQRADVAKLSTTLASDLKSKGVNILNVNQEDFRKKLASTSFYRDWKTKYGPTAWDLLEKVSGKLG